MQGTKDFIIELKDVYNETFKTKNGVELYANVDFNADRLSNRIAVVKNTPALFNTEIKIGYEILIDFSPLYRQIYRGVKQGYQNVIDEDKNLYHIGKDLIVCYREDKNSEWIGFGNNSIVKPILEENTIKTSLILPQNVSQKKFTGKVIMKYANKKVNELGVVNGDTLLMNILGGLKYWLNGEEFWCVNNRDLYAKQL